MCLLIHKFLGISYTRPRSRPFFIIQRLQKEIALQFIREILQKRAHIFSLMTTHPCPRPRRDLTRKIGWCRRDQWLISFLNENRWMLNIYLPSDPADSLFLILPPESAVLSHCTWYSHGIITDLLMT
jgi:hypothetical protein